VILKTARVPALLLEAGIIVNPDDELSLREPSTRQRIASAVAGAMGCLSKNPALKNDFAPFQDDSLWPILP